jgi:hypothetical protein
VESHPAAVDYVVAEEDGFGWRVAEEAGVESRLCVIVCASVLNARSDHSESWFQHHQCDWFNYPLPVRRDPRQPSHSSRRLRTYGNPSKCERRTIAQSHGGRVDKAQNHQKKRGVYEAHWGFPEV